MNEKAFLAAYDPKDFAPVLVTVDAALFTFHGEQLLVLLVKRSNHPDMGKWGLPGGFIDPAEGQVTRGHRQPQAPRKDRRCAALPRTAPYDWRMTAGTSAAGP